MNRRYWRRVAMLALLTLVVGLTVPTWASEGAEDGPIDINWIGGPARVDLGDDLARMDLGEDYLFAGPDDTRLIMQYYGNPPSEAEMGIILPRSEEEDWFLILEYYPVGYVRDDDKGEIDAAAILESYRQGTEEANREREKMGAAPLHIVGWYEEPRYEEQTNNLTWAMLAQSEDHQVVNYNIRILGRGGYTSAVLVADPQSLAAYKPQVDSIIAGFTYRQGNRYSEFIQGDRVAEFGLTALVAGGAGAAAAKLGLFKALGKAGKAIFVAIAAFLAAIGRFFRKIFGLFKTEEKVSMGTPESEPGTG